MLVQNFNYTDRDEKVAKDNLDKIIKEPYGIGGTNAGWCYLLAPLRTFLTDPRFISLIRQYKQKYYKNGYLQINRDFICAMYGKNYYQVLKDKQSEDAIDLLETICKCTDNNGQMKEICGYYTYNYTDLSGNFETRTVYSKYIDLIKLVHRISPVYKYEDPEIMSNILADCTAIMSESNKVLSLGPNKGIYGNGISIDDHNYNFENLNALEEELDKGRLITVCASENHDFNIYKLSGYYYITGGGQINNNGELKKFYTLKGAIRGVWSSTGTNLNNYHKCFIVEERYINNDKQYRIQQYNIEKKNRLNRTLYYKQQMRNTINNCILWIQYYDNEIKNLQARITNNKILFKQELNKINRINRNYNLFNYNCKYNNYNNYYNNYNNFNFYNKRQEQSRIQQEMDRLNSNLKYLKKQIDIVDQNKKISLLQRMDRMRAILENSNYDKEIFNLYDDFMQEHFIKNHSDYNKNVNNLYNYFIQKKYDKII